MRSPRRRIITTMTAALCAMVALTGCSTSSDDLAARTLAALHAEGTWTADATWTFASVGEPVVMTGVGTWADNGEQFAWTGRWGSTMVSIETDQDQLVVDGVTTLPLESAAAQERIRADLFHQLDPIRLLADANVKLSNSDSKNRRWYGEGTCLGDLCKIDVTVSQHPDGSPARMHLHIQQPNTWLTIDFRYRD